VCPKIDRSESSLMCGIAGVHEYGGAGEPSEAVVAEMLSAIVHRGPDDQGIHTDGGLAFGARRLSIIDLPGGHQPIANEDGTAVVAFNGEIYNYRELRARLKANGHTLRTEGDTEVLVHLYEELGDDCVHELRGMFAFAIWDGKRKRLLIARDRAGIKPLYWSDDGKRLLFGSEVKALLRHPSLDARLDLHALAAYMLLRYVPAPQTMFEGVSSLEPGHLLISDARGVRIRRWWDLSFAPAPSIPEEDAKTELRGLLEDAVASHMLSDVPYGAFLSGGIDSSTVVALMSRQLGRPVSTFAVGYKGSGAAMSELGYAKMVADRYTTDHHEVLIGAEDFVRVAEDVVWHLDQPLADDACIPNYMVSKLARQHVKMVLTGEGGDELFAGYARYSAELLIAPISTRMPAGLRSAARNLSQRRAGLSRGKVAVYALSHRDERERLGIYTPLMHPEMRAAISRDELAAVLEKVRPRTLFHDHLERTDAAGRLHRMLYLDSQHWLPDYLLLRGDKTSMAASLEARVPLLDHHLVEYAARLRPSLKVHGWRQTRKYLLREVARDLLPAPILSRSKKGFPVPMSEWLRGGARDYCHDLLAPDTVRRRGLFEPSVVARILQEHDSHTADHGSLLWGLLSVEMWHRRFIDVN
jgi:asparagine synthase (glutamine-hydrolysing)